MNGSSILVVQDAKPTTTPSTTQTKIPDGVSQLSAKDASNYRRGVGKCIWMIVLRPDIYYATKECARALAHPTVEDLAKLRHLIRYLIGTKHYTFTISPKIHTTPDSPHDLEVYVDSDWAGCRTTRKSTSGCVCVLLGCAIHHYSRTQSTIATSSGEAELYAIGSGVSEGLGLLNFLQEGQLLSKTSLVVYTDSTSA